jgi:hypothetical protein
MDCSAGRSGTSSDRPVHETVAWFVSGCIVGPPGRRRCEDEKRRVGLRAVPQLVLRTATSSASGVTSVAAFRHDHDGHCREGRDGGSGFQFRHAVATTGVTVTNPGAVSQVGKHRPMPRHCVTPDETGSGRPRAPDRVVSGQLAVRTVQTVTVGLWADSGVRLCVTRAGFDRACDC